MSGERAAGWLNLVLFGAAAASSFAFLAVSLLFLASAPSFDADAEDPVEAEAAYHAEHDQQAATLGRPGPPLALGAGLGLALGLTLGGLLWAKRHRRQLEAGR